MQKRPLSLLLAALFLLGALGCAQPAAEPAETATPAPAAAQEPATREPAAQAEADNPVRDFTDALGRTVSLPAEITRVAVSGPLAQIALFALCPDRLAGVANAWDPEAAQFLDPKYYALPELGQLYGGKGELNLETLLASGAQVVIDVGEAKESAAQDLDALQAQTGVPFVHISAATATMGETYRALGALLGMPEEAERLAAYCDRVYADTLQLVSGAEKASMLYLTGDTGLNAIAKGSYHAEIIDLLADNAAVVDAPSSKGTGNEVDMEQLLLWNPEVIVFSPASAYERVADDPLWQQLSAIQSGSYYEVPLGPHNWMGFPPSVQRYLGMLWLGTLLYPEAAQYDLYEAAREYYALFYHCDLSREQFDALTARSIGKP